MGIMDMIRKAKFTANNLGHAADSVKGAVKKATLKHETISFDKLPETIDEFKALAADKMSTPFGTAALTVVALDVYPRDRELCYAMLDVLKGPGRPLNPTEKQFINDRFMDGKDYVARSYFEGATPDNDYKPNVPYVVKVNENPYSHENEGYTKLFIPSGGADSEREVLLREAKDGKFYLWEQFLLSDIRKPESTNPWK